MAVKGNKTRTIPAMGVDGSISAPPQNASEVLNMRWDSALGSWISDRALQSFWQFPQNFEKTSSMWEGYFTENVDSFFFWKRPGSGETYIFIEQGGYLYYFFGNKGQGSSYTGNYYDNDVFQVDDNRHIPKAGEAGTQYIPFGQKLLIINGYDKPIWFAGNGNWSDFSFSFPTADVDPLNVQANYQQGEQLEYGTGAPWFSSTGSTLGLGETDGSLNQYGYRLSYLTEDGAESPLSAPRYEVWSVPDNEGTKEYKYGLVVELPLAPAHAVARRIYRTKNMKDSKNTTGEFFFCKQIDENASRQYIDYLGDTFLITPAPSDTASSTIRTDFKFGENWDGRMWLAKGDLVIYSDTGIPEQFPSTSYFDLGNTDGGEVTRIMAYYNNLIIFREDAINVVRKIGSNYVFSTLSTSIGTKASNAIVHAPKLGIIFVNTDGIYSLSGGLDGGSQIQIAKISDAVNEEWKGANDAAIAKCNAAYSPVEKEVWIHYPHGLDEYPSRGIVIHTDMKVPQYSFRRAANAINDNLWTFNRLGVDNLGRFIIGTHPNWTSGSNPGSMTTLFGPLHVWCASTYHGQTASIISTGDETIQYQVNPVNTTTRSWQSSWIEFDGGKNRIFSIEVELLSWGDIELKATYQYDHFLVENETKAQKQTYSEYVYTDKEPPVSVDPAGANGITKAPFVVGESQIHGHRKIKLRFDCNTGLISSFRFRLVGENLDPFTLIGYKLNLRDESIPVLNQSINLNPGSPR